MMVTTAEFSDTKLRQVHVNVCVSVLCQLLLSLSLSYMLCFRSVRFWPVC